MGLISRTSAAVGLGIGLAGAQPSLAAEFEKKNVPSKPNVVMIMLDDAGLWNMSAYHDLTYDKTKSPGKKFSRTPNIDSLTQTGLRMTSAYTPGAMCWPTRGSLLTGLYCERWSSNTNFSHDYTRLGTMLQKQGYFTMAIGKTHNGADDGNFPPTKWGWNRYCVSYSAHDFFSTYCYPGAGSRRFTDCLGPSSSMNWRQDTAQKLDYIPKTDRYRSGGHITRSGWNNLKEWRQDTHAKYRTVTGDWANRYGPILESNSKNKAGFDYVSDIGAYEVYNPIDDCKITKGFLTEFYNKRAVQYIEEHVTEQPADPFFLYLPHNSPHVPASRPPDALLDGKAGSGNFKDLHLQVVDSGVGRIIQKLKELKQFDDTIIIICSDNGGSKNSVAGLRGNKGDFTEGGIRTPFIVSWPNGLPKERWGQDYPYPMSLMDLAPTFLECAGKENAAAGLDGKSLLSAWRQNKPVDRPLHFGHAARKEFATVQWDYTEDGEVLAKWKLLIQDGNAGLYDLKTDPTESKPITDRANVAARMKRLTDEWIAEMKKSQEQ